MYKQQNNYYEDLITVECWKNVMATVV